ncbi:hypothetical protein [uncultured Enorma sp.]|uniref:hypothetical protein n=1 Tax=uncultured Enorma sp. TaxID=1714346 RepID=UPI0026181F06|nr:hypothetical protein [uncultured Enorma sp.]
MTEAILGLLGLAAVYVAFFLGPMIAVYGARRALALERGMIRTLILAFVAASFVLAMCGAFSALMFWLDATWPLVFASIVAGIASYAIAVVARRV